MSYELVTLAVGERPEANRHIDWRPHQFQHHNGKQYDIDVVQSMFPEFLLVADYIFHAMPNRQINGEAINNKEQLMHTAISPEKI